MHAQEQTTWILISDASRARILATEGPDRPLRVVRELEHPESRAANHELVSDREGRTQNAAAPSRLGSSAGPSKGHRSAMEPHHTPKEVEHEHFARELVEALRRGALDDAYAHLVLAAPPQFLGTLRALLDDNVSRRLSVSLNKDYTHLPLGELATRVREALEHVEHAAAERS